LLTDINQFASELEPVHKLYGQQKFVLSEFLYLTDTVSSKKKLNDLFKESNKGSPKRSFEANIPSLESQIDGIVFKILNRMEELEEIQGHANHLRQQTIELVDFKNEDQGRAVFVFTVVTVIFLPLSFVTSYFGMNTRDIRDMDREQPTFWAVALPVTLVTLLVSSVVAYWGWLNETVEKWKNDRRKIAEAQLESVAREERGVLSSYNNALIQD
jgi:Mg2+ and Co2+ transporter CorA